MSEMLKCECGGELSNENEPDMFICQDCGRHYKIKDIAKRLIEAEAHNAELEAELSTAKARIEELEAGIQMHIDKATNKPNGLEGR